MNYKSHKRLFKKLTDKKYMPRHVAEVGVYYPETSNIFDYIVSGIRATLVEPDPESLNRIKECFSGSSNTMIYPVAVYDKPGTIKLAQRNASTFVASLDSAPAIVNDQYELNESDTFEVEAVTFDQIDDGTIDVLSVDVEGSEWYVIKNITSKPAVISIETHGGIYTNPFKKDIDSWLQQHGYKIWYKDKSDSVYIKPEIINVTLLDNIKLIFMDMMLFIRKLKKTLKQNMKSWVKYLN